jgi:hypothetical protein
MIWIVNFRPQPLCFLGDNSWYPVDKSLLLTKWKICAHAGNSNPIFQSSRSRHRRGVDCDNLHIILNWRSLHDLHMQAQDGCGGVDPTHSRLDIRRRWIISTTLRPLYLCVCLCSGLYGTEISPPLGHDPQSFEPVVSHYSGHAIPANTPA